MDELVELSEVKLAQYAPRLSDFRATWLAVVADRCELVGHPRTRVHRTCVERKAPVTSGDRVRDEVLTS